MEHLDGKLYYDTRNHRVYKDNLPYELRNKKDEFHQKWKDRSEITKKKHVHRVVLVLTNMCNLGCSYCYAAQGGYGKDCINRIKQARLEQILNYLENQFPEGIEQLQFFGGEPLLEPKAIEFVCTYMESSRILQNANKTIVTNGTIANNAIISMLKKHNILVTVSVDGTRKYHDLFRTFKINGKGSYDLVTKNIQKFRKNGIEVFVQFTISNQMVSDYGKGELDPKKIAESLKDLGIRYVHLAPVMAEKKSKFAFNREQKILLLEFQRDLMLALRRNKIQDNKTVEASHFLSQKLCNNAYCGAGLDEITVDINGDIYPCFMFINKQSFLLGNIDNGITNKQLLVELENNTKNQKPGCRACPVKDICNMCIGANYIENGDFRKSAKTQCAFVRNGYFRGVSQLVGDVKR